MNATARIAIVAAVLGLLTALALDAATDADAATHGKAHCKAITHRALLPNGYENQPRGVERAGRWGWAEVDASVTKDGYVVAVHDARLGRLTGGHSRARVSDVTYAELRAMPHPHGRFRLTTTLIARAAANDDPIMVTINTWARTKDAGYAEQTLDTLYAAAQTHPHPQRVWFGGFGSEDAMHARHPDAPTFHRYWNTDIQEDIYADVTADSVDLAALPTGYFQGEVVQAVRDAGASRVATRQLRAKRDALAAQGAGITTIQGDDPVQIATRWCK